MKNAFLIGERVYLRPVEKEDAPRLQEFTNDGDVVRTLYLCRPTTLAKEQENIEKLTKEENLVWLAIAMKHDGHLIGATSLKLADPAHRRADFGILIGDKLEWDQGYGTEVTRLMIKYGFETLNLNRIALTVFAHNPRGIRAYERAGFIREGILRQHLYCEDQYQDAIVMGLLRADYENCMGVET